MGKWKDAFLESLDPDLEQTEDSFIFGSPATDAELAVLSTAAGTEIPSDFRELLSEFNGVQVKWDDTSVPYFFDTKEAATAADFYEDWDSSTTPLLLEWSRNIMYVCQENGYSNMWGIVVKPFGTFSAGQIVAFDHENMDFAEDADAPEELFETPYDSLLELVEARFKKRVLQAKRRSKSYSHNFP